MIKYPVYKQVNLANIAKEVLTFWKENHIFAQSIQSREGKSTFTFYEGPPSANGTPGIHHVLSRTVKDIFCRYKTLKGYQVKRKGGWDAHGLPVELQVEKTLGITKEDIGKQISIEEYNQQCREAVMSYKDQWDELTEKIGYWLDLQNPYITFDRAYMESLWYLLKELYTKKLLYKGYTIQPYSPAAGTGLSSHELNQPGCYKNVKDTSIVAQFKLKHTAQDYLLAWTTTPWTLPANSALAVDEKITYVKIRTFNPYTHQPIQVILAKAVMHQYFQVEEGENNYPRDLKHDQPHDKNIPWEIVDSLQGKALVGLEYEQLLPYVQPEKSAFRVIAGDFVSTEEGTGIVHIAPTFGTDDRRVAQKAGIPPITVKNEKGEEVPIVDKQGRFVKEITDFAGKYVKEAYASEEIRNDPAYKPTDVLIAIKLKNENKAFKVEKYEHSYPHCWRTDKPILYYPLEAWFIKTTACKERLIELNNTLHWKPPAIGTGRFGKWLENLVDWNLSRDRFWGTPLPIWRTKDQQEEKCIGSIDELKKEVDKAVEAGLMDKSLPEDVDLHRPYVDHVILVSDTGKKMYREPDLIDVWFDAGAMPYAQWHYPFENQAVFEKNYPADLIAEGIDQTRGWFFTLHVLATLLFDTVAFKNVVVNGLVLDKHGNKMSKRLGNTVDPFTILDQYGPDATRWYMISNANPWDNLKFDPAGIEEIQRKFFSTLQNTYNFFALYANLDQFTFAEATSVQNIESDRWILSRLHSLIQSVEQAYEEYGPTKAARAIQNFVVDDLSNWYVRLNRKRFWKSEHTQDKQSAYQTLYTCLVTVAKLASPVAPFYMERLYQDLNRVTQKEPAISVHLCDFPQANPAYMDTALEEKMHWAQTIASLVHSLRKKHKIKVRQPLSKILVPILDSQLRTQIETVKDLMLSEVNVKQIVYIEDTSTILRKRIKPNFKKLGKLYGARMKAIAQVIAQLSQEEIKRFEQQDHFDLPLDNENISLTLKDVEVTSEDIPGWSIAQEGKITVALDITVDETLKKEGIARDLVNRIQNMRKEMGLAVQDKIKMKVQKGNSFIESAIAQNKAYICQEIQALQLDVVDTIIGGKSLHIDEHTLRVAIAVPKIDGPVNEN
ncbi:MAG: isoleucine--tRNA ligase [Cytophagales bacterium]|nr:isoleucine--tRNA ligase [Cytophagales bacterium]